MRTKTNKVPKSAKSKLSDITPKKDARGGGKRANKPDPAMRAYSSAFPPHLPV